jgi:phage regulator Rha-like protein
MRASLTRCAARRLKPSEVQARTIGANELGIRRRNDGLVLVNSRDVAEHFEKRHDHVLRNIENIRHASDVRNGRDGKQGGFFFHSISRVTCAAAV